MSKLHIEIRAGEGGSDAKSLVQLQSSIYQNFASRNNLDVTIENAGHS